MVIPEDRHRLGVNYFEVVDGQQRLATILIWLAAMRDRAKEQGLTAMSDHIRTLLYSREWRESREILIPKLALGELDDPSFSQIVRGDGGKSDHPVFECYDFFKKNSQSTDVWQKLLANVRIVHINAYNKLNAFRLFETLNDRGLELSAVDLLKNYIFSRVSSDEAVFSRVMTEWTEMYENVRDDEPVKFLRRSVLAMRKGKISEARLYEEIRDDLDAKNADSLLEFVRYLNRNASVYRKILDASSDNQDVNAALRNLHMIEVAPSYTLLLCLFPRYDSGELSVDDLLEILRTIEVFHIRWGVCGQSTGQLDQIYNEIATSLPKGNSLEIVSFIRGRFVEEMHTSTPDESFMDNFARRLFKFSEHRTKYILWRLSMPTGETTINLREIQTEHIMPRSLSEEWLTYLRANDGWPDDEIRRLHMEGVDRIGNLAIIRGDWNQSFSNRLFETKRQDYAKSEFRETSSLAGCSKWTFQEIGERSDRLARLALEIWPLT